MASRELFFDPSARRLVSDLVGYQPVGSIDPLTEGDTNIQFDIYAPADYTPYPGALTKLEIGIPSDSAGSNRAQSGLMYVAYKADLTSGTLVTGKRYLIVDFNAGDDFTNVGAPSNASGAIFTASNTTPTTWTNASILWLISEDVAYNASAATIQAAVRAMSATLSGETVTGDDGGTYNFVGSTFAVLSDFAISTDNLVPQCTAPWIRVQAGNGLNMRDIQRIDVFQVACAAVDTSSSIAAGGADFVPVVTGVPNTTASVIDLEITGSPYEGSVTFKVGSSVSPAITFSGTSSQISAAIDALYGGTGKVTAVTLESGPVRFRTRLTFDASISPVVLNSTTGLSVNGDGITFAVGRSFELDLDTYNMVFNLSGRSDRLFGIELQLTDGDTITTAFDSTIRISSDLIRGSGLPLSADVYLTETQGDARWGTTLNDGLSYSAAGSPVGLSFTNQRTIQPVAINAGAGTYTKVIYLDTSNGARDGIEAHFPIVLAAGADRVLEFRNGSAGGSLIESFTSVGTLKKAFFTAYYDLGAGEWGWSAAWQEA